jgi:hypothetical protein
MTGGLSETTILITGANTGNDRLSLLTLDLATTTRSAGSRSPARP